ncbi:hypothetical protein FXB41_18895 [Bradyrhizobium canariense]|nr:hypothetical protein [Bradyrhizobium canariense]
MPGSDGRRWISAGRGEVLRRCHKPPSLRGALATKQSRLLPRKQSGLLRYARKDEETRRPHTAASFRYSAL